MARSPTRSTRTCSSASSTGSSPTPIASSCRPSPASERQQAGAAGVVAESAAFNLQVNDDNRFALRWEHSGERYFNEATATYEDTEDRRRRSSNQPGKATWPWGPGATDSTPILQVDGVDPLSYFFTAQSGYSVQDDLTFTDHCMATTRSRPASSSRTSSWRCATPRLRRSTRSTSVPTCQYGVETDPFQVTFGAQADTTCTRPRPRRTASTASTSRTTGW